MLFRSDLEDIEEIQAIRSGLEGLAARLGARRIDDRGLARMADLLGVLRATAERRDLDRFLVVEAALEDECYAASGRPALLRAVREQRERAGRYVRLAVGGSHDLETGFSERLYDCATRHDGPGAEATIREALWWTCARLARRLPGRQEVPAR